MRMAPHGERDLAYPCVALYGRGGFDIEAIHAEQREIRRVIPPREPRGQGSPVGSHHREVLLTLEHVARRSHPVLREDHTAPRAAPPPVHAHHRGGDALYRIRHTVGQSAQSILLFHDPLLIY